MKSIIKLMVVITCIVSLVACGKKDSHHIVFTNNLHREEVCIYTPLLFCRKVENRIDITESREGKLWMN